MWNHEWLLLENFIESIFFLFVTFLIMNDIASSKVILEEKNKILDRIFSNLKMIAHDLKSPTSMLKMIYSLNKKDPARISQLVENERFSRLIEGSIDYADQMIFDIIDYKEGKQPVLKEFDVVQKVEQVFQAQKIRTDSKNILKMASTPSLLINADELQIERILRNLLGNALEACSKDSDIEVEIAKDGKFVRIEVSNIFEGSLNIEAEEIFTPFYSKNKFSGNGLGLAICKQIIENHGGVITAEIENKKISFSFSLPT